MATFNNGESGLSVRNKLNEIINKVEGVTSINNDIDVTGTVTADGLIFDAADFINITAKESLAITIDSDNNQSSRNFTIFNDGATKKLFRAEDTGDISFYEDTGTTPKFFWDASAERIGLGTTTPATDLHIVNSGAAQFLLQAGAADTAYLLMGDAADTNIGWIAYENANDAMSFRTNNAERMRIDSSGNVGIGTSSPSSALHVVDSGNPTLTVSGSDGAYTSVLKLQAAGGGSSVINATGATSDALILQTTNTERMRIDSSGNVGIGTSSPSSVLHVSSSNPIIRLTDSDGSGIAATPNMQFYGSASRLGYLGYAGSTESDFYIHNEQSANIRFLTGTTERMRIDASGNLLVGKPAADINTVGHQLLSDGSGDYAAHTSSGTRALLLNRKTSDGDIVEFRKDGAPVGSISVTSSATAYNTSSDHRLKENVVELTGATDRLKQLEPKRFNFIADADTTVDGFIAHEVQTVVPEAITGTHNEVDADGNPVYQGIDQSKLVPLLTAALQEALGRIETLEAEVAALKA